MVNEGGEQVGVISTTEAMELAAEAGMDLVEVAPNERPPVCRIMDYGKFKYEQKIKKKKNEKQPHKTQLKEIRLRPKTGDHDIQFKVKRARQFLGNNDKVKINILFRGRENAHHDRGREILDNIIEMLDDVAKVEKFPGMEGGRMMSAVLTPKT